MISQSADVKAAEEFLGTLDVLIVEEITFQSRYSIWMKLPYSGNRCLKGLSSIKEAKSMPSFKAFKDRQQSCLGAVLRTKLKPL